MTEARARGALAEARARRFLEGRGLRLLAANYRCRGGELDLIMEDGDWVVFVEVRHRSNARYGSAAESVDPRKQQRLHTAAARFLQDRNLHHRPCRFDVVAYSATLRPPQWIRNAFEV